MKSQSELQLAFLEDTINHFNSTNRGLTNGRCSYVGGCAIGRRLPKELCKTLDSFEPSNVANDNIFHKLPQELQDLSRVFLEEVQHLHDREDFWDENGITKLGLARVARIKAIYKLV